MTGFVLDLLLRTTAAAVAVGMLLAALRVRRGAVRHAAWSAVLFAMLAMPALTRVVPTIDVPVPATLPLDLGTTLAEVLPPAPATGPAPPAARAVQLAAAATTPTGGKGRWNGAALALALYLAGVLLLAARLAAGWTLVRRLIGRATLTPLVNAVPVYASADVVTPVTAGILRPVVLLPARWRTWTDARLAAVLAHENAHVARRDALTSLLAQINRTIFWFHPLAWWLERRLATTAEHACDDAAAGLTDRREYVEALVAMAEAVRLQGRRVAWPALGVDGSGVLGARIDRLLDGGSLERISRARMLAMTAGCGAVLLLAIACRQPGSGLRPDPALSNEYADQVRHTARFEAARDLTIAQADALEARLAANPQDWDAREQLVTYYQASRTVPWERKVPGLRRHALWLIERHPEHEIEAPRLSATHDPDGFTSARVLWDRHLASGNASPLLVARAASFFMSDEPHRAEQLLRRGAAADPDSSGLKARWPPKVAGGTWEEQLARLYTGALIGDDPFRALSRPVFDESPANTPFAAEVRRTLAETQNARLLASVGAYLLGATRLPNAPAHVRALGRKYTERALQLQPDLQAARVTLVRARLADFENRAAAARQSKGAVQDADLLAYRAAHAEHLALNAEFGPATKDRSALYTQARMHAEETLALAAERPRDVNYSIAVWKARHVLATVAMAEGQTTRAVEHLRESVRVPPSEELSYAPPAFWVRPVNLLLHAGERDAVLDFLDRFAQLTVAERPRVLEDARAIRDGRMPPSYQAIFARGRPR